MMSFTNCIKVNFWWVWAQLGLAGFAPTLAHLKLTKNYTCTTSEFDYGVIGELLGSLQTAGQIAQENIVQLPDE